MKLTKKQKRFCDEYLVDLNATQAAVRAGYAPKGMNKRVTRLMANEGIKAYIDEQLAEIHNKRMADTAEIMEYLTAVLRGESQSEIVVVEGVGIGESTARKIQKAPDEKERLKAAELLGKRYGLFTDRVKMENTGVVIVDNIPKEGEKDGSA